MIKKLPDVVTHLDVLKTAAVVLMIIDHIGYFLLQDEMWLRAVGRASAPIWCFLIGYALTRELSTKLLLGALIMVTTDLLLTGSPFTLNILVTFILIRLSIDHIVRFMLQSRYLFVLSSLLLVFSAFGTGMVVEYGTLAWMWALYGYFTRHKERLIDGGGFFTRQVYIGYGVFTFLAYVILQNAQFGFSEGQFILVLILVAGSFAVLSNIAPATYPQIQGFTKTFLQFCGRKTLEIYVAHLLLFKVILFAILALK